jgi:hypothetical protein
VFATGGAQLRGDFDDDGIYLWQFHVDWDDPAKMALTGPLKIDVAPYHYLCDGQLTDCVPQPGADQRLDAQGDKLMNRVVYRNLGDHESIVALHSVDTGAGGGGIRWYEFRLDGDRTPRLYQQGTYAPDRFFRWLGKDYTTLAMDPTDDCTFWYVGDYLEAGATAYSTRIGAFRLPGCHDAR